MGNESSSTSRTTVDTSIAINALAETVMNCTSNVQAGQSFIISGNGNIISNSTQVQALSFNSECTQSSQNIADLQSKIATAIAQVASTQTQAVESAISAGSSSNTEATIRNDVSQNITQKTIQDIVTNVTAQQSLIISGNNNVISGFTQNQTLSIVTKSCQNSINSLKSVVDMNTAIQQESKTEQKEPISEMIGAVGNIVSSVITGMATMTGMVVLLIGAVLIFLGPKILDMIPVGALVNAAASTYGVDIGEPLPAYAPSQQAMQQDMQQAQYQQAQYQQAQYQQQPMQQTVAQYQQQPMQQAQYQQQPMQQAQYQQPMLAQQPY